MISSGRRGSKTGSCAARLAISIIAKKRREADLGVCAVRPRNRHGVVRMGNGLFDFVEHAASFPVVLLLGPQPVKQRTACGCQLAEDVRLVLLGNLDQALLGKRNHRIGIVRVVVAVEPAVG